MIERLSEVAVEFGTLMGWLITSVIVGFGTAPLLGADAGLILMMVWMVVAGFASRTINGYHYTRTHSDHTD